MKNFEIKLWTYYENIFWILEKFSGKLWNIFCPKNKASYCLDFLPAFMMRQRYRGQNERVQLQEGIILNHLNLRKRNV